MTTSIHIPNSFPPKGATHGPAMTKQSTEPRAEDYDLNDGENSNTLLKMVTHKDEKYITLNLNCLKSVVISVCYSSAYKINEKVLFKNYPFRKKF